MRGKIKVLCPAKKEKEANAGRERGIESQNQGAMPREEETPEQARTEEKQE